MKYEIELSRFALKNLSKISRREQIRIQTRIDELSKDPRPRDVKKIQGDENLYRIRAGDYRILYRIFDQTIKILILDVDHRKDIYKKM